MDNFVFSSSCYVKSINKSWHGSIPPFLGNAAPSQANHVFPQGCSIKIDVDQSEGRGDIINNWRGLSLKQCKNLATSTSSASPGRIYWTYKKNEERCIVKHTDGPTEEEGIVLPANSGLISGDGGPPCGAPLKRGRNLGKSFKSPESQSNLR